jgi:hypothetical protein
MKGPRLNRKIQAELDTLVAQDILTETERRSLGGRYPTSAWDVVVLVRWLTILGVVTMGAGLLILAPRLMDVQVLVEAGLLISTVLLVAGARYVAGKGLEKTAATLELLAAFALQGFTVAWVTYHPTGSDNWPALIGLDAVLLLLLAYLLRNRLVLVYACVNLFVWFGGETGYVSGWGMYWLGMTYPVRFIAAGLVALGLGYLHYALLRGALQGFSRVWGHFGLLVIELALWFFALFGFFNGEGSIRWDDTHWERIFFSAVWGFFSVACIYAGARIGLRFVRGYGLTFLTIDAYTFYFQFVVAKSVELWFIHLLLVGGSMVGVGIWLERSLSQRRRIATATP